MRRIASFVTTLLSYLSFPTIILAQRTPTRIEINPPPVGYSDLGVFIRNVLFLIFGVAALAVLVMLIWGAFEWITSGGDKDAVGKARGKILNALIGLAVLAVAFAIASLAAQFTGINLFEIIIPTPQNPAPIAPRP
ncbi:hypothetical protein HYW42_01110 [Candidatus Daviesbacteria bacterium]|nr:hypothetical protein [Candidatus Daviesbacteria bacterium]